MKITLLFLPVFILVLTLNLQAMPGDFDPTFGPVGFVTTSLSSGADQIAAAVRQSDGKIVVAGTRNAGNVIALARYNYNGSLDISFDGDGIVIGLAGEATSLAIQSDGKIVVAGKSSNAGNSVYTVVRYNTNGSLDPTFGNAGIFTDSTFNLGVPNSIAIQSDGKIVTVGTITINFFFKDYSIVRLNSNGSFDNSFDLDGKTTVSFAVNDNGNAVALQTDGKIIAGGNNDLSGGDFAVARLNSDGSLDNSFDGDGKIVTSFGGSDSINSIVIQTDGKIVAGGQGGELSSSFALARYNNDGSLDTSFSDDGKVITQTSNSTNERLHSLAIQTDNKIIAGGYSDLKFELVRYNTDGTLDLSFSNDGITQTSIFPGGSAVGRQVLMEPNGKIILAGYASKGGIDEDFVIARYNSDGTPSTDLGTFGYSITNPFGETTQSSQAQSVAIQSDGKIVIGANRNFTNTETLPLVARYNTDGSRDSSFGFTGLSIPGATTQELNKVIVQPDGKILSIGTYETPSDIGLFLLQTNTDGTRSTIFGGNGTGLVLVSALNDGGGTGQAVALQPDGKIIVAASIPDFTLQTFDFGVFRFNSNGSRDTSFGVNGVAKIQLSAGNDIPFSAAIQPDGKILFGGTVNFDDNTDSDMALVRFNTNGTIDNGFGNNGKVITTLGSFTEAISDIQLQSDGKIVASAAKCSSILCSVGTGIILRYNPNGSPDNSFNGNGQLSLQIPNSFTSGLASLAVQSNGKIVAAGVTNNSATQNDALVIRFLNDGSVDTTFGTNGIVLSDLNNTQQEAFSVALQSDGKIVTAGYSSTGTRNDMCIWRYLGDSISTRKPIFDFDGDGKTDISIYRPSLGQWWYLRSSDNANRAFSFGSSTDKIVPADYTGDGKTDIAVFNPSTGFWSIMRSEDSTFYGFPFGTSGDIAAPADYDGDGKSDAAVFRPSNSTWFISKSSGGTTIQQFGAAGDKPTVADYDGDGKADLAIYRVALGQWWYLRSSDGTNRAFQFGTSTDKPIQGDYTGDGKADLAFFRPSTGEWFILRSEDSTFYGFPFGANGDIPASGDYDGDGKFDAAVFRPSNTTWYISRSTSGTQIVGFGATGDQPVPNAFVP